jgi:pimeloyl-ACP methyl ester carboxylesterase
MAGRNDKVIISCAITGAIHVPTMTPHLPITPDQIAENAIGAAEAGAAIVHLHARNPETGRRWTSVYTPDVVAVVADGANPFEVREDVAPFYTNAAGQVRNLNADRVDGTNVPRLFYAQDAAMAASQDMDRETWDFVDALNQHEFPVTLIAGKSDYVDFEGHLYAHWFGEPGGVRHVLLENAGHSPWVDQPRVFRQALMQAMADED